MNDLLNGQFAPITSSIGLLRAPLDESVKAFTEWMGGVLTRYGQYLRTSSFECGFDQAMERLLPLATVVPTRYILIKLGDEWTAFFDNGHRGTDPDGILAVLSGTLLTTGLRLTLVPNTMTSDPSKPGMYGGTIFFAFEGRTASQRSIAWLNDGGRWVFEQSGEPYAFEDLAAYENKRISQRFSPELLKRYARELVGVDPFSDAAYLNHYNRVTGALVETLGNLPTSTRYVSLAEARNAFGIV
jgi:hypothetical protein